MDAHVREFFCELINPNRFVSSELFCGNRVQSFVGPAFKPIDGTTIDD